MNDDIHAAGDCDLDGIEERAVEGLPTVTIWRAEFDCLLAAARREALRGRIETLASEWENEFPDARHGFGYAATALRAALAGSGKTIGKTTAESGTAPTEGQR